MKFLVRLAAIGLVAGLGGCTYDYMNRLDRVTLNGGNAVKANLEMSTIDPSKESQYRTRGVGSNGTVIPAKPGKTPAPEAEAGT